MRRPPLIGFLLGILFVVAVYSANVVNNYNWFSDLVIAIATPVAKLTSWIMGWPLHQESAIFIYAFIAIPLTFPLLGLIVGIIFGKVRTFRRNRSQN